MEGTIELEPSLGETLEAAVEFEEAPGAALRAVETVRAAVGTAAGTAVGTVRAGVGTDREAVGAGLVEMVRTIARTAPVGALVAATVAGGSGMIGVVAELVDNVGFELCDRPDNVTSTSMTQRRRVGLHTG